ncbi:MAG: hypothetical protein K6U04_12710 [Armatimonadetes bacterium]|nr:hypothetical protein [Armatimonadota bacterium]
MLFIPMPQEGVALMYVPSSTTKGEINPTKKSKDEKSQGRSKGNQDGVKRKPADKYIADVLYGKFKDFNCLEELSKERTKEMEKEMRW